MAPGFAQSLLRELPRISDTYRVRRNEPIKLVAVEMFVEWPRQTRFS
jgi:hypothetical protein